MIRSFVAQAGALLASATLAFLLIAPVAAPSAQGRVLSFTVPDACALSPTQRRHDNEPRFEPAAWRA
jgi:hypothetical protein